MTDFVSRLRLEIDTSQMRRGDADLQRLRRSTDEVRHSANQMEGAFEKQQRRMQSMLGLAGQLGAALGAAFSVGAVIRAGDAWTSAQNSLRLVTNSAEELRRVTLDVFELSQRTASRFEAMTGLYASIQRAAGEAIGGHREVLRIVETISKLSSASGGAAASREGALFQLRQLMGGMIVQAQEFNSLIDGTPMLVEGVARSLGMTRSELQQLVRSGGLMTSVFIEGLQEAASYADETFSRVVFTMGDAFTRLQNAFQKLIGTNLGPLFGTLVTGITLVAENLDMLIPVLTGVGAAFAIAFAPMAVEGMIAAVGMLFNLLKAHPILAAVAALTGAVTAMHQFGDQVVIAQRNMSDFTDELEEGAEVAERVIDVTLKDYASGIGSLLGGAFKQIAEDTGSLIGGIATNFARVQRDIESNSGETVENISIDWQDVGNKIIGTLRTIYDWAKMIFPQLGDLIVSAIGRGQNAMVDMIEGAINAGRRAMGAAPIELQGRVDISEQEARMTARTDALNAAIRNNFNTDFIGDAAGSASARRNQAATEAAAAAAARSTAAASAEAVAALNKQVEARQRLFDNLEAQLRMSEREYQIYESTNDLLKQFPDYYAQQAQGAEDLAAETRRLAELDARRLDVLERQVRAKQQQSEIDLSNQRLARLNEALEVGGLDEFEIVERTFDLMENNADLYDRLEEGSEQRARNEAQVQLQMERQNESLTRQATRARDVARAPTEGLREGLEGISDNFWNDFADRGIDAIDDLGDAFEDVFRRLRSDLMRQAFEPVLQNILGSLGLGNGTGAAGGAAGGANILGSLDSLLSGGSGNFNLSSIVSGVGMTAGLSSGGLMGNLGLLNVNGGLATLAANGLNALGLPGLGASAGNLINGALGPMSMIGSGLANVFGLGGGTGGSVGGMIGGMVGSFLGPLGSAVGSFLGSAIGGLFGDDEERDWAFADLTRTSVTPAGQGGSWGSKSSSSSQQAIKAMADRVQQGQDLLEQMGGTLSRSITFLQYASNEPGYYRTSANPGQSIRAGNEGDPDSLIAAALSDVLSGVSFDNPIIDKVAKAMSSVGKDFEETLEVLGKLSDVLPEAEESSSQWSQALENLNDVFNDLRTSTQGVAAATAELDNAYNQAKAAMQKQFGESIADQITAIENPVKLQMQELFEQQSQRIADATSLAGPDFFTNLGTMLGVLHLNSLELQEFIKSAGSSAEALKDLNEIFVEMVYSATMAGQDTAPLISAYEQARAGVVSSFDTDVQKSMEQLANPTLAAFRSLLEQQQERLETANEIGANVVAVERLNALEQQKFFENLSDEQRSQMSVMLNLTEDFTGRIALVLGKLHDELASRIDNFDELHDQALESQKRFENFSTGFGQLRDQLTDRYGELSPGASLDALRSRITTLRDQGLAGNESALQALPQVAQQIIDLSRQLYGSTSTFRGDYDLVQGVLEEARVSTADRAAGFASEAETLVEQRDLLIEIRDLLRSSDPNFEQLIARMAFLDDNNAVIRDLLADYLELSEAQTGQVISDPELLLAALEQVRTSLTAPSSTSSSTTTSVTQQADPAMLNAMAVSIDVQQQGSAAIVSAIQELRRDLKNAAANRAIQAA